MKLPTSVSKLLRISIFFFLGLLFTTQAHAQVYWVGAVDNNWSNIDNWRDEGGFTPPSVPGISNSFEAIIDGSITTLGIYTAVSLKVNRNISIDVDITPASVSIRNYTGTIAPSNTGLTLDINGDLNIASGTFNQGDLTINISSNLSQSGGTFNGSTAAIPSNITVDQQFNIGTGGTFTSTRGILHLKVAMFVTGTFNHNQGTVEFNSADGSLVLGTNLDLYNFTINNTASDKITVLATAVNVVNSFTLTRGQFQGTLNLIGDGKTAVIEGSNASWTSGALVFNDGTTASPQTLRINGANDVFDAALELRNDSYAELLSPVVLDESGTNQLVLSGGILKTTSTHLLTLGDGVTYTRLANDSRNFIDGPIRKIGDDIFTFPIGTTSSLLTAAEKYQPIRISAPLVVTDAFTAEYKHSSPGSVTSFDTQAGSDQLVKIIDEGHWELTRDVGTSTVEVTMSWNNNLVIPATVVPNLVVAGWTGTVWTNHGSEDPSILNNVTTGTITNPSSPTAPITTIANYNRFAIGVSDPGIRYWVGKGTTDNWSDFGNWDVVSTGAGGFSPPTSMNDAIFDGADADADKNCTVDANVNVLGWEIQAGYVGTITLSNASTVTIGNNGYSQAGGTVTQSASTGLFTVGGASTGNFTMSAGNFTLGIGGFTANYAVNISGGSFNAGSGTTITRGDVTVSGTGSFTATSGNWNARANISRNGGATFSAASGTVTLNGSNAQNINVPSLNNLVINKTGTGTDNNVDFTGTLVINGNFTLTDGQWVAGNIDLKGNITVQAAASDTGNTGTLTLSGTANQNITSNNANWLDKSLVISKLTGNVILGGSEHLLLNTNTQALTFANSNNANIVTSSTNLLTIGDNVNVTLDATNNGFVDGPMQKIGNDAFTFPVGKSTGTTSQVGYHPISISAPGNTADLFTAEYVIGTAPNATSMAGDTPPLVSINQESYWTLARNEGTSDVDVTLSWNNNFSIGSLADIAVAGYDGSTDWSNHGGSGSGNATTGTITSSGTPTAVNNGTFQTFALGYKDSGNRYWRTAAANSNWNDANNWSLTSATGSSVGATVPNNTHDVYFKEGSVNCTLNETVNVKGLEINGYTGTITQGAFDITVGATGFTQNTGTFTASANPIVVNGAFALSNGTFNGNTGTLTLNNTATISGGDFNGTDGLTFNGATTLSGGTIDMGDAIFNSDLTIQSSVTSFTHSAGKTISATGNASTFTFNEVVSFQNFTINKNNGQTLGITGTANPDLTVVNTLNIADGVWDAGDINLQGNLTLGTNMDASGTSGRLAFTGSSDQNITVNNATALNHPIVINNSGGNIIPNSNLTLDESGQSITFTNGDLIMGANLLTLGDGVTVSNASDNSHVVGRVAKAGDDAFTFPIGNGTVLRQVSMEAPATASTIEVAYVASPLPNIASLNLPLRGIYAPEGWQISRTSGAANPAFTIGWFQDFCSIPEISGGLSDVVAASYNGTSWDDRGASARTGAVTSSGTVTFTPSLLATPIEHTVASTTTLSNYYWLGTANADWNDLNNWAYSSGGCTGVTALPGSTDHVFFDGNGNNACTFNVDVDVLGFTVESTYTQSINQNLRPFTVGANGYSQANGTLQTIAPNTININGNFNLSGGTFGNNLSISPINIGGDFLQTGGIYRGGLFSTNTFGGNWTLSGGTFRPSSSGNSNFRGNINYNAGTFDSTVGTIVMNGTTNQTIDLASSITFNNFTINNTGTAPTNQISITTNPLQVQNDFNITNGLWASGNILVGDDFRITSTAADNQGAGATLTFNGTSSQEINLTGAESKLDASITVNNAGGLNLASDATIDGTNQNILLTSGNFNVGGNTLTDSGDITVNGGSFTATTGSVTLNGTTNQIINGTAGTISIQDLTINKVSGELQIDRNIAINNALTLTSGNVNLSGGNILLGTTGSIAAESNANRIYGTGGYIEAIRNVSADQTNIAGLGIDILLNGGTALGNTTIRRGHTKQVGEDSHESIFRYFDIEPTTNTGLNASITFNYYDSELDDQGGTESTFHIWSSDLPTSTTSWNKEGSTVSVGLNTIASDTLTSFKDRYTISSLTATDYLRTLAPVVDANGTAAGLDFSVSSILGNSTQIVAPSVTITDTDDTNLSKLIITLSNVQVGIEELSVTGILPTGITSTVSANKDVITLSGSTSLADYATALTQIRYDGDPTLLPSFPSRTITFVASDGVFFSAPVETEVAITTGIGAGFGVYTTFDGTDDYIDIPVVASFPVSTVTLELWVRTGANITTTQTIIGGSDSTTTNHGVRLFIENQRIIYQANGASFTDVAAQIQTNNTISANNWYHVAITHDGTDTRMYLDGNLQTSIKNLGFNVAGMNTLLMGAYNNNGTVIQNFGGNLDEIRIWRVVRSESEIQRNRFSHIAHNNTNLIGYWNFDNDQSPEFCPKAIDNAGNIDGEYRPDATNGNKPGFSTANAIPNTGVAIPNQLNLTVGALFNFTFNTSAFSVPTGVSYRAFIESGATETELTTVSAPWLGFDATTRTFSGTPSAGEIGEHTIRVEAMQSGSVASNIFKIVVGEPDIVVNRTAPSALAITSGVTELDFGNVLLDEESDFNFTINNTGSLNLVFTEGCKSNINESIIISGANRSDFVITPTVPTSSSVAAGGSTAFTIKFDPQATGNRSATITIKTNDSDGDFTFNVIGNAVVSEINVKASDGVVTPVNITNLTTPQTAEYTNFGTVITSTSKTFTYTVENQSTGTGDLKVGSIALLGGAEFSLNNVPTLPNTTAVNGNFTFEVVFLPTSPGVKTNTIQIVSNDPDEASLHINISGSGVAAPRLDLDNTVAGNDFETTILAGSSTTIVNTANFTLEDDDDANIEKINIQIISKLAAESLGTSATLPSGISLIDNGSGSYTLNGSATKSDYKIALSLLEYTGLAALLPTNNVRTITFEAEDNDGNKSPVATTTVNVTNPIVAGFGNTLIFDGDDYVNLSVGASKFNSADGTIEAWIKVPNTFDTYTVFSASDSTEGSDEVRLMIEDQKLAFRVRNASADPTNASNSSASKYYSDAIVANNQWHHVAVTQSGATTTLYVDGVTQAGSPVNQRFFNAIPTINHIALGRNVDTANPTGEWFFEGEMDEVRVWSVALTEAQINEYSRTQLVGNETNLIAYWNFDEEGTCNQVLDFSNTTPKANGFIGTVNNATLPQFTSSTISSGTSFPHNINVPTTGGFTINPPVAPNVVFQDGPTASFSIHPSTPLPAWLSFDNSTLIFTSNATAPVAGVYKMGITATQNGLTATDVFTISVGNPAIQIAAVPTPAQFITNGSTTPATTNSTDFGNVAIGIASSTTFTIENTGTRDLTLYGTGCTPADIGSSFSLSGASAGDYSVNTASTNAVVIPGSSTTFTLSLTATATGARNATLTIATNLGDFIFAVTGTSNNAGIVVEASSGSPIINGSTTPSTTNLTDFGDVTTGTPLEYIFRIRNTGLAPLNLMGIPNPIIVTGANPSEFVITQQPATSIAASGSSEFKIEFTPSGFGTRSAVISIANDDPSNNPFTFAVQGTGSFIDIDVVGNNISLTSGSTSTTTSNHTNFGNVEVNGGTFDRTFVIKNNGAGDLTITSINITPEAGTNAGEFTTTATNMTIPTGGSANVVITFNPEAAGNRAAKVFIESNDPDESIFSFLIEGNGTEPEILVKGSNVDIPAGSTTPSPVNSTDFGDALINGGVVIKTFEIVNNGGTVLNLTGTDLVAISGADAADFTVISSPNINIPSGGGTSSFQIRFEPTTEGVKNATVEIANNTLGIPVYQFAIQGNATNTLQSEIVVSRLGNTINDGSPAPIQGEPLFGGFALVGSGSIPLTYTIQNTGTAPLELNGAPLVEITGAHPASFSLTSPPDAIIAPGASTTFTITFQPDAIFLRNAILSIPNNDADKNPFTFGVSGFGGVPPTPQDDNETVDEKVTSRIDVSSNDTDPNGLPITLSRITLQPSSGVAAIVDDSISYTPNGFFNGNDILQYEICNSLGLCAITSLNILVTPDSDAPIAFPDLVEMSTNDTRTINVQQNDIDPDNTGLITSIITSPANGTATVQDGKNIIYQPNIGFTGEDRLTYEVCNGAALCDQTEVVIRVFDGPIALDDEITINENEAVFIDVLSNDTDPQGNRLFISIIEFAVQSEIRITENNLIFFIPPREFSGELTFRYRVSNKAGKTDDATVTIKVLPVNDPPSVQDTVYTMLEDTSIDIQPLVNATDPEGSILSFTIIQQPKNGSTSLQGSTIRFIPFENFFGSDTIRVEICDEEQNCTASNIIIHVAPVDDAPIANNDVFEINQRITSYDILANDIEQDGDSLTVTLLSLGNTQVGVAQIVGNQLVYLVTNSNIEGTNLLRYQICDTQNNCDEASITLNLAPFNEKPTARDISLVTVESTLLEESLFRYVADPEGEAVTITLVRSPKHGTATILDGILKYTPNNNFVGTDTLLYQANDGILQSEVAFISIRVTPSDGSPVAIDDREIFAFAGILKEIDVLKNDFDPTDDPLTVSIIQNPLHGLIQTINLGVISYLPSIGYTGADSLTYEICDPSGLCDTAIVGIFVNPTTVAPEAKDDFYTMEEDTERVFDIQANDADPEMDVLITSIVEQPRRGRVIVLNGDSISYRPNLNYVGIDIIKYQVCDPSGQCSQAQVTIEITQVNDAPIAGDDFITINQNGQAVFPVLNNDIDPENDPLKVTIITQPANGFANVTTDGQIAYTPNRDFGGSDVIIYQVCDDKGLCDQAEFTINVIPETGPPIATNDNVPPFNEDTQSAPFNPADNDIDPDNESMTVRFISEPAKGRIVADANILNQFIYIPFANQFGADRAQYQICDVQGDCDTAFVNFEILPINDPPIAVDDSYNVNKVSVGLEVTQNDIELDGLAEKALWTLTLLTDENGFASLNGLGTAFVTGQSIIYTPFSGREGTDSLIYQVCDIEGTCDTASVRLNVSVPLNPPIAQNDAYDTDIDTPLVIEDWYLNDRDVDDNLNYISIRIITPPISGGIVTLDTLIKNEFNEDVERVHINYTPGLAFSGLDSMQYQIADFTNNFDTATIYITVRDFLPSELIIYNGFSPDGDGINDKWVVSGLQYFQQNKVKILNRWGTVVYEEEGYNNVDKYWDGRFQKNAGFGSDAVPEGTYFYVIDLGTGQKPRTGFVEVKRQ